VRPLARLLEGKAMAVATPIQVKRIDQTPQPECALAEAETPPSLQEFLHDNGLTNWAQSDEGRYYLLHVCMVRGRAAA
jgi:hypothetical protein